VEIGDLVRVALSHGPADAYSPYWGRKLPLYGIVLKIETFEWAVQPTVLLYHDSGEKKSWFASCLTVVNKF
jgi:hypothetical protein